MKKMLRNTLVQLVVIASTTLAVYGVQSQTINPVGRYVYKTHREGRGGFVNSLEITRAARGGFHVSFEGTYFYLAGKDETFHEGSGEGDGQLTRNVLSATLSDGAEGSCRLTMTFNLGRVTVKASPNCQMNVNPDGIYRKEPGTVGSPETKKTSAAAPAPKPKGFEVCPDPKAPCHSVKHEFAAYELPFRLPARMTAGKRYISVPFYAIIIKTYDEEACDSDDHTASIERERLRIQESYPTRKVFGSYSCPNLDTVDYDFPGKLDPSGERFLIQTFIAVYAGKSPAEANEFLSDVQTLFPHAALKRMTAGYEIMDQ